MLDQETKKKINDLRDTLVGKVPDPKSQVEQIMIALIYKFMNDMDKESTDLGGEASFFVGDFEKYSWDNLFDTKVSGSELVDLYSTAVESMEENPNIPQLFRDIFKNAYIPYKDAETLRLFLSQIDDFEYSKDSEQLGDAFEHILNSLSSQGDAGQFRTPRHIIDFIVEIVDPKKDETVLDPASGTSGFLISAFKHIVQSNSEKSSGDLLSAAERKKIMKNINGYDISPDMVRIGLANMYLHGFPEPNVVEYDALTSEDRWNEYYDVILANPPFMTPKGGIRPHNKFGLKSNRAEVLFVDYILTHLKPKGRAGIIVPEGIIFQSGKAYKELRKKLIENGLISVISLPAGVFNPYSGVKTSILIIDKSQKNEYISFYEVNNDGFSLGSNRNSIDENDLPEILVSIQKSEESSIKSDVAVSEIEKNDFSLSANFYLVNEDTYSSFPLVDINEFATLERGTTITKKTAATEGTIPVVGGGQAPSYFHDTANRVGPTITVSSSGAYAGFVNYYQEDIFASDCFTIKPNELLNIKYLFRVLKYNQQNIYNLATGAAQPHVYAKDFNNFKIPLPPLEKQQEIVDEIEQYQKIIDGARLIEDNYKPAIVIDPTWVTKPISEISNKVTDGSHNPPKETTGGKYLMLSSRNIEFNNINFRKARKLSKKDFDQLNKRTQLSEGDILLTIVGTIGRTAVFKKEYGDNLVLQRSVAVIKPSKDINPYFLSYLLQSHRYQELLNSSAVGVAQKGIYLKELSQINVPVPKLSIQNQIVDQIYNELKAIENNKKLIELMENKITNKINSLYS
ncbi:N-6 DNA methylase [Acidimicrobiaceae bacterium]|nr:N-6 DNA methylase [Acidimicrobiaceae bacterium]